MNSSDYSELAFKAQLANITALCARKCKVYNVRPKETEGVLRLAKCKEECPRAYRAQLEKLSSFINSKK